MHRPVLPSKCVEESLILEGGGQVKSYMLPPPPVPIPLLLSQFSHQQEAFFNVLSDGVHFGTGNLH